MHPQNRLRKDFLEGLDLSNVKLEGGEEVSPPMPLPWYPNEVAWQMNFSRNQLRKEKVLTELFEFIKAAAEAGTITRQVRQSFPSPVLTISYSHYTFLTLSHSHHTYLYTYPYTIVHYRALSYTIVHYYTVSEHVRGTHH